MWLFGGKDKNKGKKDGKGAGVAKPSAPLTTKEAKSQALLAQMRTLRAEIGEENLQEIVKKLKLDEMKKQVRSDIDNDPRKRDRLLDELRYQMQDTDKPTRY